MDEETFEPDTQFVPREDDVLWQVIEIIAEKGDKYKVSWAGNDPDTSKPWPPSWVFKRDCTDDLVRDWKRKKALKKGNTKNSKLHLRADDVLKSDFCS
jgi:hypothetical protein